MENEKKCQNTACSHRWCCQDSVGCLEVTSESKKGIASEAARLVYNDYKKFSVSSLLESDGKKLEEHVHEHQLSIGAVPCFKRPY